MTLACCNRPQTRRPFVPASYPHGGTVYGVILNHRPSVERLAGALAEPPYKGAPKAPVLYIKPANTVRGDGAAVTLPRGADKVAIGATVALVMGMSASRLDPDHALEAVAGATIAADLSLPHDSFYRPAIRETCFDGSCPLGPDLVPLSEIDDPDHVVIRTLVNGRQVHSWSLHDLLRPLPRLLADVTEFMTLRAGDILLVGTPVETAIARAGDRIDVAVAPLGGLSFTLAAPLGEPSRGEPS